MSLTMCLFSKFIIRLTMVHLLLDLEHLLGQIKSSLQLSGPLLLPLLGKKILNQRH
ncbi:hypothetical protein GLYMA_18G160133v4 [Glycine max]|nr:hypothetical protein GLYMA_18G160133v4 [Glycine max]KAH1154749.1 hypothetical protein GYH30_050158 [Glycine max]